MGKQPTIGQKKSKESIARAAQMSRKGLKKKWSKGKVSEKLNLNVVIEPKLWKQIEKEIGFMKVITISAVSDKFKIIASLARKVIRHFGETGLIRPLQFQHQQCLLYTGTKEKKKDEEGDKKKKKGKKQKK